MKIETLHIYNDECEGYAIKINGTTVFRYVNQFGAPEDSTLLRNHSDVMSIPELLLIAYSKGILSDDVLFTVDERETENSDEFYDW